MGILRILMEVYKPIQWLCPKCGGHPHRSSYIGYNDTLTVTCAGCGYWESCLPRDREQ